MRRFVIRYASHNQNFYGVMFNDGFIVIRYYSSSAKVWMTYLPGDLAALKRQLPLHEIEWIDEVASE